MTHLKEQWRKLLVLASLIACMACCQSCFPRWYVIIPGQWERYQERLDDVFGEAELVVGAEHGIRHANVSPDGRWLTAIQNERHPDQILLVDLENREYYELDSRTLRTQWLDNNHVYLGRILRVPDMVWWKLERRSTRRPDPNSLEELADADHIFAINENASSILVATDPNLPYMIGVNWDGEELEANLAHISHTIICAGSSCPVGIPRLDNQERYYSPDGRYYVEKADHPTEDTYRAQEVIFDAQTGERVAHMYKDRWWLRSLGWAPDSSGTYFELHQQGSILDKTKEAHPIYKLLVPGATPGPPIKKVPLPEGSGLINSGK